MIGRTAKLNFFKLGAGTLPAVAVLSGIMNVITLSGSMYMLEVYDRVLPSRSVPTLVGVSLILLALYAFLALFDIIRSRILVRLAISIDERLSPRVFAIVMGNSLRARPEGDNLQPQRDLDQVRAFLSGAGPGALFDLPWLPLYLLVCFSLHPLIGLTALGGSLALMVVTILADVLTRRATGDAVAASMARNGLSEAARRNAEVAQAMGMIGRLGLRWDGANTALMLHQRRTSDVSGGLGALSKVLRMILQSAVLAVGAYLVITGEATGGIMIAGSILASRAIAPAELAIANWKGFAAARQGWARLKHLLAAATPEGRTMQLPPPRATLSLEGAGATAPGGDRMIVDGITFRAEAGSAIGLIGPSGAGKSTVARLIAGVWPAARGKVRLDGAALDQWDPTERGRHTGYLPQDVSLFAGSVADNIARFDAEATPEAIIAAATAADVHDLILRLPDGYRTEIGSGGAALSAGQRQRIGLARALYGDPFLVVLDEPNSNLDSQGELALTRAIAGVRARGGILVIITHRPSVLSGVDLVGMIGDGRLQQFGPKEEVLAQVLPAAAVPAVHPLKVVQS